MQDAVQNVLMEVGKSVLGKEHQIKLSVCCLLAGGHLLIEDLPGMGKTTLAQSLGRVFGLGFRRVQFTSDLLPADILGFSIYDAEAGGFTFHPGPVFCQLLLADEINRATPKTQSALLEAMEEGQVTVDGVTRPLPQPFFVIATQNPSTLAGTYPLPESQFDRFMMRISLGYPDAAAERVLLERSEARDRSVPVEPMMDIQTLQHLQAQVSLVKASSYLLDYVQRLIAFTRDPACFQAGLSPRAAIALVRAAKGLALISGRDHVVPEDVQAVFGPVAEHRLQASQNSARQPGESISQWILNSVDVFNS